MPEAALGVIVVLLYSPVAVKFTANPTALFKKSASLTLIALQVSLNAVSGSLFQVAVSESKIILSPTLYEKDVVLLYGVKDML